MLMGIVFELKGKLENKFGHEFVDVNDDPVNVERRERTAEEKAAEDTKREAALDKYLQDPQPKKRKVNPKKVSIKRMLVMKNQDLNPLDENLQPKGPTKTSDRYVMERRESFYDKVGNKSKIMSWRFDHAKNMWLIISKIGHQEYYSKESQFESWMKIDLKQF
ncbi:hypothetical protein HanOQP8_Chr17g0664401 [Helianthus annuus]|nr:hypothetical protein HanIR_Chr17g0877161 [Helianthus annuus]KAJ0636649.1 hypothetical protein HanOQP8_Chr17g0664401 [Helianthus annuus]